MGVKKDQGFGLSILIVTTVVILVGFMIWQTFISRQSKESTAQNQQPQSQQKTDPNEGYIVIKEWGVRFKPIEGLNDVIYKAWPTKGIPKGGGEGIAQPEGSLEVVLSTQSLADLSADCGVGQNTTALWRLYRSSRDEGLHSNVTLGKVGDYYYYYFRSQAACAVEESSSDSEGVAAGQLLNSFKALELAK